MSSGLGIAIGIVVIIFVKVGLWGGLLWFLEQIDPMSQREEARARQRERLGLGGGVEFPRGNIWHQCPVCRHQWWDYTHNPQQCPNPRCSAALTSGGR